RGGAEQLGQDAAGQATVRVEASRLDRLMDYSGELLVTHARFASRGEGLRGVHLALQRRLPEVDPQVRAWLSAVVRDLERIVDAERRELEAFGRLTRDLGEAMKQVRMLPLAGLAPSWRQLVRESAQQLGRKAELVVEVGDIELDKYVLDRIREPLIHLLRNSVAHGLEPAAERAAQGKAETGRVVLHATLQGAHVRLEVSDDGRGLDARTIGECAVRKGLVERERLAQMPPAEVVGLIFQEGFSTAAEAGRVSGRGVGLSVVRSHVAGLGGEVQVVPRSRTGGAGFELVVPVSAVSRRGLLVRAGASIYALPIEHVQRTVRVSPDALEQVDGEPVVRAAGAEPLRLRWLAQLMGRAIEKGRQGVKVVVLERGAARLGLAVDEVLREDEYVIKRLPANLVGVVAVDGAVILADGALAVAVNVPELFQAAGTRSARAPEAAAPSSRAPGKRILVVDDMLTIRALHRSILEAEGHLVTLAADGEEAWAALQRERFDLVVSDVQMPRLDGCALTARIRADDRLRDLPVVLVTARGRPEEVSAGGKAGANEYLIKGQYESGKLLAAVRRFA
ncbi:MAG: response regulator, partial [Deltaproteobacteria bacterium]|nr:response regulator [Deltaproteobacteria bacterium]